MRKLSTNIYNEERPMNKINKLALLAAASISLLAVGAVRAGDVAAGKEKSETCMGCHGVPGYVNAYPTYHVPKLGGQHEAYIVSALKAYRDKQRAHNTMHANAASLSDEDMADIAAYLSSNK